MKTLLAFLCLSLATFTFAGACLHCGPSDGKAQTEPLHTCLGFSFGTKTLIDRNHPVTNGLLLGLAHNSMNIDDVTRAFVDERCDINGLAIELFALTNVGTLRGASIATILSHFSTVDGAQITLLANSAEELNGVQVGLALNRAEQKARGLQVGLVNLAGDLKGLQIGLLNINRAGWVFPLINFSW